MEPQYTGQPGQQPKLPGQQPPQNPLQPRPATAPGVRATPSSPLVISDFRPRPSTSDPASSTSLNRTADATPTSTPPSSPAPAAVASTTADEPAPSKPRPSFQKPTPPEVQPLEKPVQKSGLHDVLSIVGVLVSALLLAFCLITFVFQSYQVDGPSMQTTLENNDHLIVWKIPKTIAKATGQHYIPNRGDVIIFNEPISDGTTQNKQLIKRVMALPGERITVKDSIVTVYNKEHPEGFQPDKTLPYGNVITTTPGNVDVTLRENQVFVCGDNRTNSLDSRIFGPVGSDQIIGKLVLRVLPLNTIKTF